MTIIRNITPPEPEQDELEEEDYSVYGTFHELDPHTGLYDSVEIEIGVVSFKSDATFKDMPQSLEINGHAYYIEK